MANSQVFVPWGKDFASVFLELRQQRFLEGKRVVIIVQSGSAFSVEDCTILCVNDEGVPLEEGVEIGPDDELVMHRRSASRTGGPMRTIIQLSMKEARAKVYDFDRAGRLHLRTG